MKSERENLTTWEEGLLSLSPALRERIQRNVSLAPYATLRVGGAADYFYSATHVDELAEIAGVAQRLHLPLFLLGEGSNICVSDRGVRGFVLRNACKNLVLGETTRVDTGYNFMRLFVESMRAGLSGLEFAVGIPGTVGGALVSNAGAYRANICDLVRSLEVVEEGERKEVAPEWMEFSYRDSCLRREGGKPAIVTQVTLQFKPDSKTGIRLRAKDFQYQRILKQPWEPSAGSFFKNYNDKAFAETLPNLPEGMKAAGVVPTAVLSEACGLKGFQIGGAAIASRHANFIINRGGATASDIRAVAEHLKKCVWERFGVRVEEEALYVGEW
jgi:UDP-N-acetylmuramate dehydrogenase